MHSSSRFPWDPAGRSVVRCMPGEGSNCPKSSYLELRGKALGVYKWPSSIVKGHGLGRRQLHLLLHRDLNNYKECVCYDILNWFIS